MSTTKRCKTQSTTTQIIYPRRAVQHAAKLAQDFSDVYIHIEKTQTHHGKLPSAIKEKMKKGVESVVAKALSKRVCASFPSNQDKKTFQDMISNMICDLYSSTVPQDLFDNLEQSFRCLVPKIQALESASQHLNWYPADSTVGVGAKKDADALITAQAARLSIDHEIADSMDDESSDDQKETNKQVVQPAIRLQGSVDFSPDQSDLESDEESEEDREEDSEVEIKEENEDQAAAMVSPDPTVFTVTLGVPIAPGDHRFSIRFHNERVIPGLRCMPSREIWQLVHHAIRQDRDIPNRPSSLPRITEVHQQDDGRLAFRVSSKEDLDILSTNVQWARDLRDTIAAGIKTYRVVFEFGKNQARKMEIEEYTDRAWILDEIRKENSEKIPSLSHIGAIRDVMMLQDPASKRKRINYILVFGSREAANAALEKGLTFHKKSRACTVHSPGTQWHQQCSHCQGHTHAAKDCPSTPSCRKCGYRHATRYCTSATIECANCHGGHVASSKECPQWLTAEEAAHRSYRFPAEGAECQIPTPATAVTLPTPTSPLPIDQTPPEMLNHRPETALPPATLSTQTQNPPIKAHPAAPASAILQTIDEFRAFVAARENHGRDSRKRKRAG
ncbi:hypothetical protein HO173_009433 [Letharia columbiana]|uniref:Uncharacterized protein n=1 Tax=Letharia columbiana TaxID=112416 RepID=A0A8H6FPL7_9LECA|nr:uncharacterized protein HO173_009433 [Letharia columbiana]KAF6232328.1 hypothetical protein HO173_009433 [Letharia columbiana]